MDLHDIRALLAARAPDIHTYEEVLRHETLSVGLAVWPAGSVDDQRPHHEDEVYYVLRGRARVRVGDEEREVGAGSLLFVGARVPHQFLAIEETIEALVFWAPPHHSRDPR